VLDAFLGSGTTVIAAERTGRRCYAMSSTGLCRHRHSPLAGTDRARPTTRRRPLFDDLAGEAEASPMAYDDEGDHEVGYRQTAAPPQFVKGQSGNPRGRPARRPRT